MSGSPALAASPDADRKALLSRRIRWFVAATISYNVIEAAVAITAGTIASSAALIGFGLDSIIEVASAAAVAWQFAGRDPQAREKVALRIIAVSFFALAAYVTLDAVQSIFGAVVAQHSTVGLILAGVSLLVMPFLSYGQRRTGRELNSRSAVADSKQTLLCSYLSAVLLVGLALNSLFGWTWADPLAALVIAVVAVNEGRQAWRGDTCCAPTAVLIQADDNHHHAEVDSCCAETPMDEVEAVQCGAGCGCSAPITRPVPAMVILTKRDCPGID